MVMKWELWEVEFECVCCDRVAFGYDATWMGRAEYDDGELAKCTINCRCDNCGAVGCIVDRLDLIDSEDIESDLDRAANVKLYGGPEL